jgi:hypothetical protein
MSGGGRPKERHPAASIQERKLPVTEGGDEIGQYNSRNAAGPGDCGGAVRQIIFVVFHGEILIQKPRRQYTVFTPYSASVEVLPNVLPVEAVLY